jgi:hypothetical protein
MRHLKGFFLFSVVLFFGLTSNAQGDILELVCPLANGAPRVIRASDKDYQKTSEYGVMFTSKTDSLVLAVHNALVVIVARAEDKTFDIVLQFKQYYFWYTGVITPKVKAYAAVKPGDVIGTYKPDGLLEVTMYLQEEPMNLRKYLKCK